MEATGARIRPKWRPAAGRTSRRCSPPGMTAMRDALDRLMKVVYPELRRLAHRHLARRRAGESLESAALANEAYLKLVRAGSIRCESRAHFLALCAQIMRRILVDHARQRGFARRGGNVARVTVDEALLHGAGAQHRRARPGRGARYPRPKRPSQEPRGRAALLRGIEHRGNRGRPWRLGGHREA